MHNLSDTIGRFYLAFASVPKPKRIDGCPCCIDRKETGVLLGKSLRAITPQEMASYASSAFLTVGGVADYLYFLPRILEITATEPSWWPDPEVTGRAIRTANPESWTAAQRSARNEFLEAVIGTAIEAGEYHQLDGWVCAIARMGLDVRPYLTQIAACPAAVLAYFEWNVESLSRNALVNAFWELPCPGHDAVVAWFFSPEIARIPFAAYGRVLTRST
ncbi:MAG TPA: hypothetical protein VH092_24165 [Urbifossiella sp.]|jgi:hypothetical protein|nr:hypothetical protein [Urbifossiella sp.]